MLKITRQEQILKLIKEKKAIKLSELSEYFNVSTSTVRRDLLELSQRCPVSYTHGGAIYTGYDPFTGKRNGAIDERLKNIGEKAVELVQEGDTIIIDGGRTTFEMAKALRTKKINNLTVVATNIAVADIIDSNYFNIIIIGGEFRGYHRSLVGPIAEETIKNIRANKAFIGATGISEKGIYTAFLSEMNLRKYVCESAQKVILLADQSKFGNESGFLVNPLGSIKKIVTNDIPDYWKDVLQNQGIEVILAH